MASEHARTSAFQKGFYEKYSYSLRARPSPILGVTGSYLNYMVVLFHIYISDERVFSSTCLGSYMTSSRKLYLGLSVDCA